MRFECRCRATRSVGRQRAPCTVRTDPCCRRAHLQQRHDAMRRVHAGQLLLLQQAGREVCVAQLRAEGAAGGAEERRVAAAKGLLLPHRCHTLHRRRAAVAARQLRYACHAAAAHDGLQAVGGIVLPLQGTVPRLYRRHRRSVRRSSGPRAGHRRRRLLRAGGHADLMLLPRPSQGYLHARGVVHRRLLRLLRLLRRRVLLQPWAGPGPAAGPAWRRHSGGCGGEVWQRLERPSEALACGPRGRGGGDGIMRRRTKPRAGGARAARICICCAAALGNREAGLTATATATPPHALLPARQPRPTHKTHPPVTKGC